MKETENIGLSIVKKIVGENHNGTITANGKKGEGGEIRHTYSCSSVGIMTVWDHVIFRFPIVGIYPVIMCIKLAFQITF